VHSRILRLAVGGLALFVLTVVAGCGGGSSTTGPTATPIPTPVPTPVPTPSPAAGAADVTILITGENLGMSFSPNPATVKVGQTVAWHNLDPVEHHTASANLGAFDTGTINPGATSTPITVAAAGSFQYHCRIHQNMVGTLTVTQ
jgi:plastocyanin